MLEHYNSTFSKSLASYSYFAPKFITKGKDGYLWNECGDSFLDLGMGLGSVSVGYSCPEIDNAVCHIIKYGINFSRPSIHEKELTEIILEDFNLEENAVIRYSKSSSMLLGVIPRVCRYITQKTYIACTTGSYLGNTDWYLSTCTNNGGILKNIKDTTLTFQQGDIQSLKQFLDKYGKQIACIVMEPYRNKIFSAEYYQFLRDFCNKNNIILVFDETISGYRFYYPFAQKGIDCRPDITIFGKAIANGYALAGVIIKEKLYAQLDLSKVFSFSSTHAGENIGLVAAKATIAFYKKYNVVQQLRENGDLLIQSLDGIIQAYGLTDCIKILGMPSYFKLYFSKIIFQDLFCKYCFENKILCRGTISICYKHSREDIESFINVFKKYCEFLKNYV